MKKNVVFYYLVNFLTTTKNLVGLKIPYEHSGICPDIRGVLF